jgi:hypothetical protein
MRPQSYQLDYATVKSDVFVGTPTTEVFAEIKEVQ